MHFVKNRPRPGLLLPELADPRNCRAGRFLGLGMPFKVLADVPWAVWVGGGVSSWEPTAACRNDRAKLFLVKANDVTRGNSNLGDPNWRSGKLLCETDAWPSSGTVDSLEGFHSLTRQSHGQADLVLVITLF